ncbi:MAG: Stealth CR1 domain-containing protein [Algibacter sp.]|uniref:Stealth CR1 domain-containing protein n=1 Tax=Algibacter sp. TaxID=1872428 RepID=UPI00260A9D69|nr:Stealth CR1 domain-containing protein [Algibacter sp.]MDG1728403.1 Stealth CR1 domain-containing protein [Algibacter sp.]MDG2179278.1 Stealth CR1 domain-containing protein [Algibacter sp.]
MNKSKTNIQVDAVITWVDGNDKNWQQKINTYSETKINFSSEKHLKRYNSIGEINIAIKAIIKFAPFFKNIFLVTDNQTPESFDSLQLLAKNQNINLEIVDHKVIFNGFQEYLPCFNSCSIGSMLFRIPNLSEHFVIFNDDTFIMRNVSENEFFIHGQPIIRGEWQKFNENKKFRTLYNKIKTFLGKPNKKGNYSFKKLQQNSAKLANTEKYIRRFHTPVCLRKSTLHNFFKENPTLLEENIKHRFRNKDQFIISSLSEHLEIKKNTFHFRKNAQLTYFRNYKQLYLTKLKLKWFEKNKNKIFITFQSLDMADDSSLQYILNWIDKQLVFN